MGVRFAETEFDAAASMGTHLRSLLPALCRLDQRLEFGVKSMQANQGSDKLLPFRGLFVDRDQVDRLLSQPPGSPHFQSAVPAGGSSDQEPDPPGSALASLSEKLGLSSFDVNVLLLALAPEIDLRYEWIYSYLQDDVTRKRPTVELALNLFCTSSEEKFSRRADLSSEGNLLRNRLLHIFPDPNQVEPSFLAHYFKLDHQIKHLLLGHPGLDERLAAFCQLIEPTIDPKNVSLNNDDANQSLLYLCAEAQSSQKSIRLYFSGGAGPEKREAAEALAAMLGAKLLNVRLDRLPDRADTSLLFNLVRREAELQQAILFISPTDAFNTADAMGRREDLLDAVAQHVGITILAGRRAWESHSEAGFGILPIDFGFPDFAERHRRWQHELEQLGVTANPDDVAVLAGRFRLTAWQIAQAAKTAQLKSRWNWARNGAQRNDLNSSAPVWLSLDELSATARNQCGHELAGLANKIEPRYGWADLVLPADQKTQLREICAQAECRPTVYGEWGFDRKLSLGKGLNVLFAGPPGTGKTMAAEVIAHELRLDLYRIDLSQIVSKYIGETEKNLDRIFHAAENSNAILFFDEADALFGKRSEVRDSHDRYANIEISYLLQKMEEYQGISVLATNLRQNLDEAFVRRLQAIVEFPFPDEEYRRCIWESVFPKETPLADDIHFDLLAREVQLAGGNIKNMALAAAFYAAADGGVVRAAHLIQAAHREHQKLARSWNPGALGKIPPSPVTKAEAT